MQVTQTTAITEGRRRPTNLTRRVGVLLTVALMVLATASPAFAASKQGSQNCTYQGAIRVRSETTGTTVVEVPIGTQQATYFNGGFLQVRFTYTTVVSGTWKVSTPGYLYSAGTYAYCSQPL